MGGFQGKSLDQPSCVRSDDGRVRDVVDAGQTSTAADISMKCRGPDFATSEIPEIGWLFLQRCSKSRSYGIASP
jgi:hypothetical protein